MRSVPSNPLMYAYKMLQSIFNSDAYHTVLKLIQVVVIKKSVKEVNIDFSFKYFINLRKEVRTVQLPFRK
jgi:hypothetical protein